MTGLQFELTEGAPAESLTIAEETLGETIFEGYDSIPVGSSYYVRFEDNAILDESGNVIVIDGTSASFDEIVPSAFGNVLPAPTLQAIEGRLFDADDAPLNGRGQIFAGVSPLIVNIDQENIFDTFDLADDGLGGLNVTILPFTDALPTPTGLNNIAPAAGSTNPADLNNIETAAGGETDPEALNDIETAAGGDEATCWDDVLDSTNSGQSSTFSHNGSAADLLKEEASCGS